MQNEHTWSKTVILPPSSPIPSHHELALQRELLLHNLEKLLLVVTLNVVLLAGLGVVLL